MGRVTTIGRFTPYYIQQFAHFGCFSWVFGILHRNVGEDGLNFTPISLIGDIG